MLKKTASLLVVLLSLATLAAADDWSKTYTFTGKPEIYVDANDANLEVRASDGNQVEARLTTRGWKIGPDDVRITESQSGNRVDFRIHHPNRTCFGFCNQSIRLELKVPHSVDLRLHTGDGNILVVDATGASRLDTNDGNVEVRSFNGQLSVNTHDGNVVADGRFDGLDIQTGDGNVRAEAAEGSKMSTGWVLRTGDGNLTVRLPSDFSADLDAQTGDGRVILDFPIVTTGSVHENSARGKMNAGGPTLELHTGDGDIRLEKD